MAGALARVFTVAVLLFAALLGGCDAEPPPEKRELPLPEQLAKPYTTGQVTVSGLNLVLLNDGGGCRLQAGSAEGVWLKPMAPCYFMQSPGTRKVQVYRHDKTTRVVAVVGTPAKGKRCGQEVQGLIIKQGKVTPSGYTMRGSVYCAEQGLHNFQYDLFTK